jgi:hypothetical protein
MNAGTIVVFTAKVWKNVPLEKLPFAADVILTHSPNPHFNFKHLFGPCKYSST